MCVLLVLWQCVWSNLVVISNVQVCLSLRESMGEVDELYRDGGDAAETILIWLFRSVVVIYV
jgi:hypothetical protein